MAALSKQATHCKTRVDCPPPTDPFHFTLNTFCLLHSNQASQLFFTLKTIIAKKNYFLYTSSNLMEKMIQSTFGLIGNIYRYINIIYVTIIHMFLKLHNHTVDRDSQEVSQGKTGRNQLSEIGNFTPLPAWASSV